MVWWLYSLSMLVILSATFCLQESKVHSSVGQLLTCVVLASTVLHFAVFLFSQLLDSGLPYCSHHLLQKMVMCLSMTMIVFLSGMSVVFLIVVFVCCCMVCVQALLLAL